MSAIQQMMLATGSTNIVPTFHTAKANPGTPKIVTTDPIATSGNLIVISIGFSVGGGTVQDVADNYGNTWVRLTAHTTADASHVLAYAQNCFTGPGHTFTVQSGADVFFAIAVEGFANGAVIGALDQQSGNATSATTIQPGSITPSQAGCVLVTGMCGSGVTPTINQSFTITDSVPDVASPPNVQVSCAYLIETTATAKNPTWTNDVSANIAASMVSLKSGPSLLQAGNFVAEGDSITRGVLLNTIPWPAQLGIQWYIRDIARSGDLISNIVATEIPETTSKYLPSSPRNIAFLLAGTNDILNGATAAVTYANIRAWCLGVASGGWAGEIWVGTLLPAGGAFAGFNSVLTACNALLIADHSFCTKLVRFDQVTQLQDPTDPLYFQSDDLHPTNLAAQFMAGAVVAAM